MDFMEIIIKEVKISKNDNAGEKVEILSEIIVSDLNNNKIKAEVLLEGERLIIQSYGDNDELRLTREIQETLRITLCSYASGVMLKNKLKLTLNN